MKNLLSARLPGFIKRIRHYKRINRVTVIQNILKKINGNTYLEIGVSNGSTFEAIDAKNKIGVDPMPPAKKVIKILNQNTKYFKMTSDDFFKNEAKKTLGKYKVDVVLIDGLHEYRQVLRDVKNCLKYLNKNGVIVMHDCNPWSATVALPAVSIEKAAEKAKMQKLIWMGFWTGDVWKSVVYLRSFKKDINLFVLNCDCGLGIITKGKPENMLDYSVKDIEKMGYQDLNSNRKEFLNLKNKKYFSIFIKGRDKII